MMFGKQARCPRHIVFMCAPEEHLAALTRIVYAGMEPKTIKGAFVDVVMPIAARQTGTASASEIYPFKQLQIEALSGSLHLRAELLEREAPRRDGPDDLSEPCALTFAKG